MHTLLRHNTSYLSGYLDKTTFQQLQLPFILYLTTNSENIEKLTLKQVNEANNNNKEYSTLKPSTGYQQEKSSSFSITKCSNPVLDFVHGFSSFFFKIGKSTALIAFHNKDSYLINPLLHNHRWYRCSIQCRWLPVKLLNWISFEHFS